MKKLIYMIFLLFVSLPVLATEQINSFHADINIQLDGSVIITETLNIRHEGIKIRRGFIRSLPTNSGEKYQLISVKRNGRPEPSFVEQPYGFYEINTGDDSFLPKPADSTFEIKYQVWNVLRKYDTHDELYWNVTGDNWDFPILKASAQVYLPQGAEITKQTSFIGRKNSKNNGLYHQNGLWSAPKPLSPGEQLTIVAGFTPNVVDIKAPPLLSRTQQYLTALYILFLGYCITVWYLKGKDPTQRSIMPIYDAPKDVSASTAYLLMNNGKWSSTGTMAALVQMIKNGFLTVNHQQVDELLSKQQIFTFCRTEKQPSNDEEHIYESILKTRNLIITNNQYCGDLNRLDSALKQSAKQRNKLLYTKNNKWIWPAWIVFAFLFYLPFHSLISGSFFEILFFLVLIPGSFYGKTPLLSKIVFIILGLIIFSSVIKGDITQILLSYTPLLLGISLITALFFHYIMYCPSVYGQDVIEQLKGLKMFLSATHKPSEAKILSQKQMEDIFPYALALGLEEEWESKFKSIFGSALYNNLNDNVYRLSHNHHHFRNSVCKGLTPPRSHGGGRSGFSGRSGFGGGGFSGGGFGGGGGRGR